MRNSNAALPEELEPAIVSAESVLDAVAEAPESGVWQARGSAHIAHVLAGDDGVEDVEVSVHCPHCSGAVLIDVAHEDAFMTALSLIAASDSPERPARQAPADVPRAAGEVPLSREVQAALRAVPVARAMNPSVVFVHELDPVANLPMLFAEHDDPIVIVTDQDSRPVGVARAGLLLRAAAQQSLAVTVQELPRKEPYCLRADAPLAQALELFTGHSAREIAVIGENGKLAGLLLPEDLLRIVATDL